jgi:hypothetical protein
MGPENGRFRPMAIKSGQSLRLDEEVDGCSKTNSPLEVERLWQEGISMGSRGKGRIQENEKDRYEDL